MTDKPPRIYLSVEAWLAYKSVFGENAKANPTINQHLIELELIKRAGLIPIKPHVKMSIPLIGEGIIAGFPSPATDYIVGNIDLNEHIVQHEAATFFGNVKTLSMLDMGFDIGDMIVVDRSIEPQHEDVVLALVNNDHTMKQLMIGSPDDPKKVWLKASNPVYDDIHFKDGDEMVVFGVVTWNLKNMLKRSRKGARP